MKPVSLLRREGQLLTGAASFSVDLDIGPFDAKSWLASSSCRGAWEQAVTATRRPWPSQTCQTKWLQRVGSASPPGPTGPSSTSRRLSRPSTRSRSWRGR